MDWITLAEHADTLLAAATGICALLFHKKLWSFLASAYHAITGVGRGVAQLSELTQTVQRIERQLMPNGGKSLHDIVHLIRAELGAVQVDLTKVTGVLRISWDSLGSIGLFYANADGLFTYASVALIKWLRRSEAQLRGRGWLSAVVPESRDAVAAEWDSCVADRRDFLMRFAVCDADGAVFEVIATASPVIPSGGSDPVMWVGTIRKAMANEARYRLSADEE
jgi:PAS domain-containing protein